MAPFLETAVGRFELPNGGFKVRCLTTWRHRNMDEMVAHANLTRKQQSCRYLPLWLTVVGWLVHSAT